MKSPEFLTAQLLVDGGYTFYPPLSKNAPSTRFTQFVDSFPDTPDNIVAASTNLLTRSNGRLMNGTPVTHPGVQIRVRSLDTDDAYDKIRDIYNYLYTVRREIVTVGAESYRMDNMSPSSEPRFIGVGMDDQRPSYVFDLFVSYTLIGE